jgi:hypothetical protein
MQQLSQQGEVRVGHRHHPGIGRDGAEGINRHLGPGRGQGVENNGLSRIGKPDDAATPTHDGFSVFGFRFSVDRKTKGFLLNLKLAGFVLHTKIVATEFLARQALLARQARPTFGFLVVTVEIKTSNC